MDPRNCIWILKFASTWIRIRALSQNFIINFKKCWHSIFYQFYLKNRYLIKNWYIKIMAQKESSELRWWIFVWPFNLSSLFLILNQDGEFCQFLQPFILFLIVCIWIEIWIWIHNFADYRSKLAHYVREPLFSSDFEKICRAAHFR